MANSIQTTTNWNGNKKKQRKPKDNTVGKKIASVAHGVGNIAAFIKGIMG